MGKRITQQARGKGSLTFRVRKKAYKNKVRYPALYIEGAGKIVRLFNSAGHSAPLVEVEMLYDEKSNLMKDKVGESYDADVKRNLMKGRALESGSERKSSSDLINNKNKIKFTVPAAEGVYEGQEVWIGNREENKAPENGDIVRLKDVKQGERVFNIENVPGKGGKILRSSGSSGIIGTRDEKGVEIIIRRRRLRLNENCRVVVGVVAGDGRKMKPIIKAGKKHYMMKAIGRKWHRTSAVKVNAIDHPFGGGRGKRIKSKIAKRNSPPGLKVGHIRPRKTGKRK